MTGTPPKVFISYSHDTVAHQERVLDLADRLRADGIDAEIDQYNDAPPERWPRWCEQQIEVADVVLMVCTETYHRRVRGEEAPGRGLGVVWEAAIIRQLIYDAGTVSSKFVPVLFTDGSLEHIPTPIKGWSRYVVDSEEGYESLYRRLTGQPRLPRPALGTIRTLPTRERRWAEATREAASSSLHPREMAEGSSQMEPISMIVTALAMGATAAVQKVGGKAVEEAYDGLKKLIADRFKRSAAVAALEEEPSSEAQKKALEEALTKADAAKDPEALKEILAKARQLTQALEKAPRAEIERAVGATGFSLEEVEAINLRLENITASGTGVSVKKSKFEGDIEARDISAGVTSPGKAERRQD